MTASSPADWSYVHHLVQVRPLRWQAVAERLRAALDLRAVDRASLPGDGPVHADVEAGRVRLYGIWRSQIGQPRDLLNVITCCPRECAEVPGPSWLADRASAISGDILAVQSAAMSATLRPLQADRPTRQGNFAFRWFVTPEQDWETFLELCRSAWPGFESAYDSQVIGLWRIHRGRPGHLPPLPGELPLPGGPQAASTRAGMVCSLLLTRRPDLAMWERSKIPADAAEQAVRDQLSRRYDLCESTWVYTTTLLSAEDRADEARWT